MAQFVEDSSLGDWEGIGCGGFGQIYKARHYQWGYYVAIKLLLQGEGNEKSLLHEIKMMRQATNPYVMAVRGIFKGRMPSGRSIQLGVVMDLMETGSLASLQEALRRTPPWPLVFRLAHQVALGLNFLHSLPHPVLHQDLKPQNVLLDDTLNAKLTDFGLARISCSVTQVSKDSGPVGGTITYMPPEAFKASYKPTRSCDIYSYGILLWSIATGKQPYEYARTEIIMQSIPEGERPPLADIKGDAAGLTELTRLMKKCWDQKPERRPTALECATETEQLFQMHKDELNKAVYEVLEKLKQKKGKGMAAAKKVQRYPVAEASGERSGTEVNLVLLGMTGTGKSASGNTILGKKEFISKASSKPVTTECQEAKTEIGGRRLRVIDTPDIFEDDRKSSNKEHVRRCLELCQSGPCVYLLVIQVSGFTDGERTILKKLETAFGREVVKQTVVLFTRGGDLQRGRMSFEAFLHGCQPDLKKIVEKCGRRCVLFENSASYSDQVEKLMQIVDRM